MNLFADEYKEDKIKRQESKYDPRNTLNDLTGKEWLKLTASFWLSENARYIKTP